jgi:subtilisin family serine protease
MADNRILVKMRPTTALAADSRANVRPLRVPVPDAVAEPLGIGGEPAWYLAELPDAQEFPWDSAHARVADQLGIAESDVLFVEPDLVHDVFPDDGDPAAAAPGFAVGDNCAPVGQDKEHKKAFTDRSGWHLEDGFSELGKARDSVLFADRRTRIAHFDTGYFATQITVPRNLRHDLERNFVDSGNPGNAADPDNKRFLFDNSGHGTGTISILAGQKWAKSNGLPMGGAPDADIVPLRIADSVVLLRTSAFATALDYAVDIGCDLGTMSMGGLPSRAWRDSIDRAYLAGFCLVAAAGNCTNGLPTRHLVYPARFGRVIAACGVMADGKSYSGLSGLKTLEGNYGPDHLMFHAISAYTPNIWWAKFGCTDAVRENGEGTSSATPQVAAAVALWFEKYKASLPRDFRRVEAVRHALFSTAKQKDNKSKLGNGVIQALKALGVQPVKDLPQTPSDDISFAFLRVITGLGITEKPLRESMFDLEIAQRWLSNPELQKLVPDPDAQQPLEGEKLGKVLETLIEDDKASLALRRHLADRFSALMKRPPPSTRAASAVVPEVPAACDGVPTLLTPTYRRLRVYAADPSLSTRLESVKVNEATLDVRWEKLKPGPIGEYLEVVDKDAKGVEYAPVDLDDRRLLAQDGWSPSEGNPQFHQQMTYAVAMTTIGYFERALGRPVLWRPPLDAGPDDSRFVQRLTIRPHALHQANAFYSPKEIALQFGYFEAGDERPGEQMPGSRIYTCLSHDIIAHETTHAILDGMHRRFIDATNIDMPALHEGFADIVALLQHFTMREPLRKEIARTRGDLASESALGSLALQFGTATGNHGALREAIGHLDENGAWKRLVPDPAELQKRLSPHGRGAILVAAVFDAYLAIYKSRTSDLIRIYTQGTGVLPDGAIHPDLVNRLAGEAAKTAGQVLTMCIRALDYLPPVDVTFFDYLRALITADFDFVPEDPHNYRVAFVEAFRARGIYPPGAQQGEPDALRTLSVDTVRWDPLASSKLAASVVKKYARIVIGLRRYADASVYCRTRKQLFELTRKWRARLHEELQKAFDEDQAFAEDLGLDPKKGFEVHALRRAARTTDDGRNMRHLIISLTQSRTVPATQDSPEFVMRGGSTLVVDLAATQVNYRIYKRVNSDGRTARAQAFAAANERDPMRRLLFGASDEPFAALHSFLEVEE